MISKKILILGGAGHIGQHLIQLIKKNNKIYLFDKKKQKEKSQKKIIFIKGDTFKKKNINKIPNIDIVFFLIGLKGGTKSLQIKNLKKYLKYNSDSVSKFLDIVRKKKVKKIIFTSTEHVYGNNFNKLEDSERTEVFPKNYYGFSKLLAEKMLYSFYNKYRINIDILRIPRVIALNQSSFLHKMVKSAINKNIILIKNNNTKFNFIYIEDLIFAMNQCLKKKSTGFRILNVFNNSKPENLKMLAFKIKKEINKKVKIHFSKETHKDHNPKNLFISNKKIKKILYWQPRYSNKKIIKKIIKFYEFKKHPA